MIYLIILCFIIFIIYLIFPLPLTNEYFIDNNDSSIRDDDYIIKDDDITDDTIREIDNDIMDDNDDMMDDDDVRDDQQEDDDIREGGEPPIITYDLSKYHCNSYRNYKYLLPDNYVKDFKGSKLTDDDVACIPNNIDPSRNFREKDVLCMQLQTPNPNIIQCSDYFAKSI
jgi:hypothetical protein